MSDSKKAAMLIIAGRPKAKSDEPSMPPLSELMAELGSALAAKDYEGAASAFQAAMDCCGGYETSDEEE